MEAKFVNIAIAVKDIDEAIKVYGDILGMKLDGNVSERPTVGIKSALIRGSGFEFQLVSPLPGEKVLSRFLERRGEGIYRLAFAVKDIEQAVAHFRSKGAAVFQARASTARGPRSKAAFTHPKALKGVMLELLELPFLLDMNDTETIQMAFADFYHATIMSEQTDPDKLHDLKSSSSTS